MAFQPDESVTEAVAHFAANLAYSDLPDEVIHVGRRCLIDGIGQYIAGSDNESVAVVREFALAFGGRPDTRVLGGGGARLPAPLAAAVLGTAGHALDWDDTQMTRDSRHINGLLAHPTNAPLAAAMCLTDAAQDITAEEFMTAFHAGFEVECKLAEWMKPEFYKRGLHASATVGTIAACITAARLLRLPEDRIRHALAISASTSAAAIRANVGTMTKPYHFGAAAEAGIRAALLARYGLDGNRSSLDGAFGFASVFAGGYFEEKLAQGFGAPFTIVDPGVLVKPYPSGILSHQSMDAALALVSENDIRPEDVERIEFDGGSNILKPLSYLRATDHMQAKFCIPALLAMIVLRRRAGPEEFSDTFVASAEMQDMQSRIETRIDPAIEEMGFDRIRSKITIHTKGGAVHSRWADERYRGGPELPMTDAEIGEKFCTATSQSLSRPEQDAILAACWSAGAWDDGHRILLDAVLGGR